MISLLPIAILAVALTPANAAYNAHSPYKVLTRRSIVSDPNTIADRSFDFVIAGGGVSGLALAARLAEYSNFTVCLIEAGGSGDDVADQINIPGYSYLNGLGGTAYDWKYKTTPQVDAGSTVKSWPRGKGLGGSGATNGLYWTKAAEQEYDAWNTLNPGASEDWGWAEMQKYTQKCETFTPPTDEQVATFGIVANPSVHGDSGPIHSGNSAYIFDIVKEWVPTWQALGFTAKDLHGGNVHGVNVGPSTLNTANQTRSYSKSGYIDSLPARSNLVILTGFQVTKINWNSTTAGAAVAGGVSFSASSGAQVFSVTANKEVIVSGGVIGSPQILQLSGVGPAALSSSLAIESVVDLPVGYNLQDHFGTGISFNTPSGTTTWGSLRDDAAMAANALTNYKAANYAASEWSVSLARPSLHLVVTDISSPLFASFPRYVNSATGYTSMADLSTDFTTFAATATSALAANVEAMTGYQTLPANVALGLADQYTIQNSWLSTDVGQLEILFSALSGGTNIAIKCALQHPYSRGTIMINSTDAFNAPVINPGYLGLGYDVEILKAGIAFIRKLGATAPMNTIALTEQAPSAGLVDDELTTWIGTSGGTDYHPLGTASMLPQDKGGVVDTKLVVYGTTNVRVVDASVIPLQMSSHTMSACYAISEKVADIIKAKYAAVAETPSSSSAAASGTTTTGQPTTTTRAASSSSASAGVGAGDATGAAFPVSRSSGVARAAVAAAVVALSFL
ncbi:hypothetical protein BDY24DRAFT_369258 [Mrakia frigida]|uniref:GMC family oxidoreductase n=1 Tax=Mrakia frigida TaxID=29902 RepID=UPI003FCC0D8C